MNDQPAPAAEHGFLGLQSTATTAGAEALAIAMTAAEDMLRKAMQQHPYAVIAGGLALGALAGLFSVVKPRPYDA